MERVVQPEILDSISHDDPAALANRRDLRIYNRLMGNLRWFGSVLRGQPPHMGILELGAGDGSLGLHLLNRNLVCIENSYTAVDLIPRPPEWPKEWQWLKLDLRNLPVNITCDVLLANLILHQFDAMDLREIGSYISKSAIRRIAINEPVRRSLHLYQVPLSRLLRVHAITLHDAKVSIRAGFRGDEIQDYLGLERIHWTISWRETFLGANRVILERR